MEKDDRWREIFSLDAKFSGLSIGFLAIVKPTLYFAQKPLTETCNGLVVRVLVAGFRREDTE